jgi:uncharacterized membrane protein YdfJ with MMPL/SSD domain
LAAGRFVHRFRWFLLLFWLAAVGASVPFATRLPALLSGGGFQVRGSESTQVSLDLNEQLHVPPSSLTVVFHSATTNVSDPAYQQELNTTISAAILPLLMALTAIPLALAVIYPITQATPVTTSVTSIVSIIGLGLAIDYSLFITRRFREELACGFLHADRRGRDALVYDAMELARPTVDDRVLTFLQVTTFHAGDFTRVSDGSCRLHPQLARAVVATCNVPQPRVEEHAAWLASLLRH